MEAEAGQRAAERTYERNLATVQEDAKKRVRGHTARDLDSAKT